MRKISLDNGVAAVDIQPECGGISGLRIKRDTPPTNLLWPTAETDIASGNIEQMSYVPITPFTGTPAGGSFTFEGRKTHIAAAGQAGGLPSRRWIVQDASNVRATLTFFHEAGADGWPWAYQVLQRFELIETTVRIYLAITNVGTDIMPGAIGLSFNIAPLDGALLYGGGITSAQTGAGLQADTGMQANSGCQLGKRAFATRLDGTDSPPRIVWPGAHRTLELAADRAFAYMNVAGSQPNCPVRVILSSRAIAAGDLTCDGDAGTDMAMLNQGDTLDGAVLLRMSGTSQDAPD